jgi:hypothetical protein
MDIKTEKSAIGFWLICYKKLRFFVDKENNVC